MKTIVLSVLTAAVISVSCVRGDATLTERQGKYLRFNGASDLGKLNFDRILSQWNKSNVEEVSRPMSMYTSEEPETTTVLQEVKETNVSSNDLLSVLKERSYGFKKCIFGQKKRILENPSERKNIIFKCFKVEVINGLRGLMSESDSISLLNGYIVLEAVDKPGMKHKKHSKKGNGYKKTVIKDKEHKTYSEYYKNIIEELFQSGESSREFKGDNTEAIFSEYGRYLVNEIADNLSEEEEEVRSLKDSFMDNDLLSALGEMSRKFVLRLNLFRGVSAIMKRSQSTGVTFDLELDDLTSFGYDDDDDDDKKSKKKKKKKKDSLKGTSNDDSSEEYDEDEDEGEEEEEEEEEEDDEHRDAIVDEEEEEEEEPGRGKGKGKGKGKNKMKKKKKMLKKLLPYLLIPLMIQAAMLPLAFKFLLAFAIKALIAGKIALLLVAINLIKNTEFKSDEDEYIERVGQEHYGYGKGEEYGAWVNKRAFNDNDHDHDVSEVWTTENHPYRAYTPIEENE